ncbi:hypothetical protein B0H14DRAFT_2838473 [Mycena olivaceomarginata]|nr:hypothetical protein B0H14DRAFT_2838473 [Mycena olivaceomarginata]
MASRLVALYSAWTWSAFSFQSISYRPHVYYFLAPCHCETQNNEGEVTVFIPFEYSRPREGLFFFFLHSLLVGTWKCSVTHTFYTFYFAAKSIREPEWTSAPSQNPIVTDYVYCQELNPLHPGRLQTVLHSHKRIAKNSTRSATTGAQEVFLMQLVCMYVNY